MIKRRIDWDFDFVFRNIFKSQGLISERIIGYLWNKQDTCIVGQSKKLDDGIYCNRFVWCRWTITGTFESLDFKVDWISVDLGGAICLLIRSPKNNNRMFITQSSDANSTKKIIYGINQIKLTCTFMSIFNNPWNWSN